MKTTQKKLTSQMAAVAVIFDKEKRVLLTKRHQPTSKHSHGKWQFPGGTIEFGEHPRETVLREVKEEVNVDIQLLTQHPVIHSHVFEPENIHALVFAFPAQYVSGIIDIRGDKHTGDAKWYKEEDIDFSLCLPKTKEIIDDIKEVLYT